MKKIIALAFAATLLSGCASLFQTDDVRKVKKIVILSTINNRWLEMPVVQSAPKSQGLAKPAARPAAEPILFHAGSQPAELMLSLAEQKLGRINNWQVLPASQMVTTSAYQKFMENYRKQMSRFLASDEKKLACPPGQQIIHLENADLNLRREAARLAYALHADAVVVIDAELAFKKMPQAPGSTGKTASWKAASTLTITMLNQKGQTIIRSGSGLQSLATADLDLKLPQATFDNEAQKMFAETIDKNFDAFVAEANQRLK